MAVRGTEVFNGVGGEILIPREGGDAYDAMLHALHDVIDVHDPCARRDGDAYNPMTLSKDYEHLAGIVEGASEDSYADMMDLYWLGKDWQAQGGEFNSVHLYGSTPLYELHMNIRKGVVNILDHERSVTRRRVGRRTLASMTHNLVDYLDNPLSDRPLSNGYVVVPQKISIDIRDTDGNVTGDSVRRSLEPHGGYLDSLAQNFTLEAQAERVVQARRDVERANNPRTSYSL